jgi:prepilin-type N-terminal cleavage/methylation domain-containing protein
MADATLNMCARRTCQQAFTLFEMMIVMAIIGVIATIGIPSVVSSFHREGMRKAVGDFVEACSHARAAAIFSGQTAELVINPKEKTFSINARGRSMSFKGEFPDNIHIEILGVNFIELQEADQARVRFLPNGLCDEFAMVIRSDEQQMRKITLDVITGLPDVEVVR